MIKKITVVCGCRADYGLLEQFILRLSDSSRVSVTLVLGSTLVTPPVKIDARLQDKIGAVFELPKNVESSKHSVDLLTGLMNTFSNFLHQHRPDAVVLLGDRFEMVGVSQVCVAYDIPIVHFHGGERTAGSIDDIYRDMISHMSRWHFVAANQFALNLRSLGITRNVYNMGSPGNPDLRSMKFLDRRSLAGDLQCEFREVNFMLSVLPETRSNVCYKTKLNEIVQFLVQYPCSIFASLANADLGSSEINSTLVSLADRYSRVYLFEDLGRLRYLSLLKQCNLVLGNSSSGILEAPGLQVPAINIGRRQEGRPRADSVLDVSWQLEDIETIVRQVLEDAVSFKFENPYDQFGGLEPIVQKVVEVVGELE